jgi:hypothetical protein
MPYLENYTSYESENVSKCDLLFHSESAREILF